MSEPNDLNKEKEVAEDYRSALSDLHVNSKPLITMLTMLADENNAYAQVITQVLITHLKETVFKLPALYLIDSIVKNVGHDYKRLIGNSIASMFAGVFLEVDEKTRKKLYELRQTWNEVFPKSRLFLLDTNIHEIDPAWPITSQPRIMPQSPSTTIHVNPKFKPHTIKSNIALQPGNSKFSSGSTIPTTSVTEAPLTSPSTHDMEELQKLQTEKRVLQETRKKVEKMMQENPTKSEIPNKIASVQNIYIAPWKAKQILPNIASNSSPPKDPRLNSTTLRDSYVPPSYQEHMKDSKAGGNFESSKVSRDPRIMASSSSSKGAESPGSLQRDPRLLHKPSTIPVQVSHTAAAAAAAAASSATTITTTTTTTTSTTSTSTANPTSSTRDPRLTQTEKKIENRNFQKNRDHSKSTRDPNIKKEKDKRDKPKESERPKEKEREKEKKKHDVKIHLQKKIEAAIKDSVNKNKEKEKKKETKEKVSPKITLSKDSSKIGPRPFKSKLKKELSCSSSEDKMKSKVDVKDNNGRSKRREHIRPRVISPVEDNKAEETMLSNSETERTNSSGSSNISSSSGKRSRHGRESDSEDSDHYDANKPLPSVYANKKVKPDSVTSSPPLPLTSQNQTFNNTATSDIDLRQLAPQQENRIPSEVKQPEKIIEPPSNHEKSLDLGLFGKEDVDLRQLSVMARIPANQVSSPGALTPFVVKPDEDMRIQTSSNKGAPEGLENQDPRFSKVLDVDKRENFASPIRKHILDDINAKKPCFSSPHAAKWEKFREKNPEFKEYQRQASICERLEADEPNIIPSAESHGSGFGKWERGKRSSHHYKNESERFDEPLGEKTETEGDFSDENYKYMINQLTEQHKKGEISSTEFSRCMENIRLMVEQGKIRELQAKEREFDESEWLQEKSQIGERENEALWSKQCTDALSDQFHGDGKWTDKGNPRVGSWHRGRLSRGHGTTRGMGSRSGCSGHHSRFEEEWTFEPDLPIISEDVLRTVYRESETRTIDIDSRPREIRTYGERAMILMDWNEPRTLTFEPVQCRIVFDGGQFVIPMSIGEDYRDFTIDGEVHRVRLGVPTQELMIDGKGYQCFFGGKPITVHLAGKNRTISLDGKPPKVNIGQKRNTDFLLGKIELILNAKKIIPLYLDAKPQRFNIDGKAFVIKFVDAFSAVNINGVKFPVEFGGLPISISVRGCRRFLRFSSLPSFVIPGKTVVRGMDSEGDNLIPSYPPSPPPADISRTSNFHTAPVIPAIPSHSGAPRVPLVNLQATIASSSPASTFPYQLQPPLPGGPPVMMIPSGPPPPPNVRGVVPGSYMTSAGVPTLSHPSLPPVVPGGPNVPNFSQLPPLATSSSVVPPTPAIDVQDLLTRLVKTGIIESHNKREAKKEHKNEDTKEENKEPIDEDEDEVNFIKDLPPVESMFTLENLRKRNIKLIKRMYRGMQCSSCGLRYPPESTQQYSHHLDWHFRMNKKQQDSTKKVNTRKFYLCVGDWVQYEEIEDLEERVPSMFEVEGQKNTNNQNNDDEDGEDIPSVAVSTDPSLGVCPICHETFDQFYHQNTEDWHYKYAIQVECINYHPGCHQDHLKAVKQEEERIKKEEEAKLKAEEEKDKESTQPVVNPEEPELEEIKMEDEDIQEIEKVKDEKPKVEIDLTEEEGRRVTKQDEEIKEDSKKSSLDKVKEALRNISAISNGISPFRIKEEPMDMEGDMKMYILPREPPLLADIPIKMEIEDEENQPPSFDVEDEDEDDELNECESESPNTSWIAPATINIAETDIASSIDGNTELTTAPASSQAPNSVPKIKISVSIPTKNNIEDHLNALNAGNNCESSPELNDTNHIEEFIPPPFSVNYNLKPGFRGIHLEEQPLAQRGVEVSSLCSVM